MLTNQASKKSFQSCKTLNHGCLWPLWHFHTFRTDTPLWFQQRSQWWLEIGSVLRLWSCSFTSSLWKTTSVVKHVKSPCTFTAAWLKVIFVEVGGRMGGNRLGHSLWNGFKGVSHLLSTPPAGAHPSLCFVKHTRGAELPIPSVNKGSKRLDISYNEDGTVIWDCLGKCGHFSPSQTYK